MSRCNRGKKARVLFFFKAFHNVINHSFIVANMNCAPNVTNLVLFAKIKGWIIAQHHRWKICTLMSYESDMIIFPKFSKMLVWAGLHTQSEHTHTHSKNKWKSKKTDRLSLILLMSLCRKYDLIIKTKCLPQTAPAFPDDPCVSPCQVKKLLHNNHLVSVIPKSIYSRSHPAEVMHHSTANLTCFSNTLKQPWGTHRISFI